MLRRRFFILLVLCISPCFAESGSATGDPAYREELVGRAAAQKLSQNPYWKILVHYRPRWISGVKSEIKAQSFFNSPDGRMNPEAELSATVRAFFAPVSGTGQHPQCRFIDRYRWLRDQLHFDSKRLPEQPCLEYKEWRQALAPESVSLIFSSYYMSNPSSTFGHTLLRLNHHHASDERLLDYGVGYAANPTTYNPLLYGIFGMVGGFLGEFSNTPYFMKVEEYNDVESRELWEYDLKFTRAELDRLMLHLWTVGHIATPYYFFDKNCSFMLLTLLDAANPDLHLAEQFNSSWWVIPADTVRAVAERKGLVEHIGVRPSLSYRINKQRRGLSKDEDRSFLRLISSPADESATAETQKQPHAARVFDLALDYVRYLKTKGKNKLTPEFAALQSRILLARSENSDVSPEIAFTPEEVAQKRPDGGHDTARASFVSGYNGTDGPFVQLGFRPAFHDLNSSALGYPREAQIEVLDVNLRYCPDPKRLRLDQLTLVDILSINPWDPVFKKISWMVRLGADPVRDFNCQDCLEYKSAVGAGVATEFAPNLLGYALAKAELGFGAQSVPGYRLGPAAETGLVMHLSNDFSIRAGGEYFHPLMGYLPAYSVGTAEARVTTSRNSEIRVGYDAYPTTMQGRVGLNVYF